MFSKNRAVISTVALLLVLIGFGSYSSFESRSVSTTPIHPESATLGDTWHTNKDPRIAKAGQREVLNIVTPQEVEAKREVFPESKHDSEISNVATIADDESIKRIQPWIDDIFLIERKNVSDYFVVKIDNRPIFEGHDRIRLQLDQSTTIVVNKTFESTIDGGAVVWGGNIDGVKFGTVSAEGQVNGKLVFRIRSEEGFIVIRPSPVPPYYISYKSSNNIVY